MTPPTRCVTASRWPSRTSGSMPPDGVRGDVTAERRTVAEEDRVQADLVRDPRQPRVVADVEVRRRVGVRQPPRRAEVARRHAGRRRGGAWAWDRPSGVSGRVAGCAGRQPSVPATSCAAERSRRRCSSWSGTPGHEAHQQVGDVGERGVGGQLGGERVRRTEQRVVVGEVLLDAASCAPPDVLQLCHRRTPGRHQPDRLVDVRVRVHRPGHQHPGLAVGAGPGLGERRPVGGDHLRLGVLRVADGPAPPRRRPRELQPVPGPTGRRRIDEGPGGVARGRLPQPPAQTRCRRVQHLARGSSARHRRAPRATARPTRGTRRAAA